MSSLCLLMARAGCEEPFYSFQQDKPMLMHLQVLEGQLLMVVGEVGSGKSSLLYAMLGEMAARGGEASVSGDTLSLTCALKLPGASKPLIPVSKAQHQSKCQQPGSVLLYELDSPKTGLINSQQTCKLHTTGAYGSCLPFST